MGNLSQDPFWCIFPTIEKLIGWLMAMLAQAPPGFSGFVVLGLSPKSVTKVMSDFFTSPEWSVGFQSPLNSSFATVY